MPANEEPDFDRQYIDQIVSDLEHTRGGHASPTDPKLINYVNSGGYKQFWYHDMLLGTVWYPLSNSGRKLSNLVVDGFYRTSLWLIALAQHQFGRYMRTHPK